MKLDIRNLTW